MSDQHERLRQLAQNDPEAARRLLADLRGKVVHPHPAQQEVLDVVARFKVLDCGRRWGKTKLAAKIALGKARKRDQMIWWVAPTYKVVKRGYREVLRQLPAGTLAKPAPPDTHFDAGRSVILKFKNGTQMEFYSAERPEGMLGEGVDYAVLDEAAIMPPNIWEQVVRPTLMDREGGALLISTPRGRNWFYKAFKRGQDPQDPEWASWQFPSWTNIHLPEGEIEEMRKDLPAVLFAQEVEAKFIAEGSSIFIIPPQIIKPLVKPSGHVVLGIDLAKTVDYTVIYGANAATRQNCVFERFQDVTWPRQRRRIVRLCNDLYEAGVTGITLMVDGTGVGDPMVDELEELGYDVIGLNFTTFKDKMVRLLAKDMEDGKAFVVSDYVDEFEAYAITQTPKGRVTYGAPAGGHDDVVSAKMLQHWGIVMEGTPGVHVMNGVDVDDIVVDFEGDEDEPENVDPDYFMDYDDDVEVDTGVSNVRQVAMPSVLDRMNHPGAWG